MTCSTKSLRLTRGGSPLGLTLPGGFLLAALLMGQSICRGQDHAEDYFETSVRPILVAKCQSCHGEDKQSGELRLDSRKALLDGGSRSAAIRPGDPSASLLIKAVRRSDDLAMPPDDPLTAREITEALYGDSTASNIGTVQKLLQRLEAKRCIRRDRRTYAHRFFTTVSQTNVAGQQLQLLAEKLSDGSLTPFVTHLVQSRRLSKKEKEEIQRLLE